MRYLKNLTFRTIVLASLGAPAFLLWIAGYYAWDAWRSYNILQMTVQANVMADDIVAAAGLQALERGVASALLSANGPADVAGRSRIAALRAKSDALWKEALGIADQLQAGGYVYEGEVVARRQAEEAYAALGAARARVDTSLTKDQRDIAAAEWIPVITGFINAAARMRLTAFGGDAFPPHVTYPNLTTKQSVWLASEFAGLERATLATVINSNAPAAPDVLQRLSAFRQNVEFNLASVRLLRDVPGTDPKVVEAIDAMQRDFLGSFQDVRRQLYAEAQAASTGERRYSLTAAQWIDRSTAAINSILAVSTAYSETGIAEAKRDAHLRFVQMLGYVGLFVAMIVTSIVTVTLLLAKLRQLEHLRDSMARLATGEGDLGFRLDASTDDEIGQTSAAFNRFADKLQQIIGETRAVVRQLADAAAKLNAASDRVTSGSSAQSDLSLTTAAAVEEITASIAHVAERAQETLDGSREAGRLAEDGVRLVQEVADEMRELAEAVTRSSRQVEGLGERSREIGGIVGVIRGIAEQTNLLALNAAIEAARAGEAGRGFAVVADEVRKLAEGTGNATGDISRMIEGIQRDTGTAVEAMHASSARVEQGVGLTARAATALEKIVEGAHDAERRIGDIANATREESVAGSEIARNVERVAHMAEDNKAAAIETADDARMLAALADRLNGLVGRFKG